MKAKAWNMKAVMGLLAMGAVASSGCLPEGEAVRQVNAVVTGSSLGMVVDHATGTATVFSADTNTILGTVPGLGTGTVRGDCSITADGAKGFFTNFGSTVTVADLATSPPTLASAQNPIAIANPGEDTALSPDGKYLLVCDGVSLSPISVIDVATQTQISTLALGVDCNAIDVCSDGSVLVSSYLNGRIRRLTLSASGVLTNTGESLVVGTPMNVYCAPNAAAGVAVSFSPSRATSFKVPGLTVVTQRSLGGNGVSGAFHPAGDRAFFRTTSGLNGWAFDPMTGELGSASLFQVSVTAPSNVAYGIDQLAVHPSGTSLYISQPNAVQIRDASTGAITGSITGGTAMTKPTGVCFGQVLPNQAPVARCADRTVAADGACHGTAIVDDGSSDPDGDLIDCVATPAGPYDRGTTPVTLTCTDPHGKSSSCTAEVTVVDQGPPAVSCPADQTLECNDGHGGAVASFSAAASDVCDAALGITCAPASGSTFALGATGIACSATDVSSNTGSCTSVVTVVDTVPPVVSATDAGELWPPNHRYHRIDLDDCITSIQDTCGGTLDIASHATITCCTSDEPDNGAGDGNTVNDCVIVDGDSVDVRAERAGDGNGRVYTIHYTVRDGSNNATHHTCTVGVPHSQGCAPVDDGPRTTCP